MHVYILCAVDLLLGETRCVVLKEERKKLRRGFEPVFSLIVLVGLHIFHLANRILNEL